MRRAEGFALVLFAALSAFGQQPHKVYLDNPVKTAYDGNTYEIAFFAMTNVAELADNRWPARRMHVDLSLNGGTTFVSRIGFGVPVRSDRVGGAFDWSPPLNYDWLTENAVLRCCQIDGSNFALPQVGAGNYATNRWIESGSFTIAGIQGTVPAHEAVRYNSLPFQATFRQAGAGPLINCYWISEATVNNWSNQFVMAMSNCVVGFNTRTIPALNLAAAPATIKLVYISVSDPAVAGYSPQFHIEP